MAHPLSSAPNLFAFTPYGSPQVVGFLYWLCAWADPRYRETSEELHQAGVSMLQSLLCGIGGVTMDSFSQVEFVKHRGPEYAEACFLRVNGTHCLLLSEMESPDNGQRSSELGYWGDGGLILVAICCEELPISWHRVETDCFTLAAWQPDPGMHYLSLAELNAVSVFQRPAEHCGHLLIDEFRRALVATVDAEQQFQKIPPGLWGPQAWRGFYKRIAASFGGKLFFKPLGEFRRPFCRIEWFKEPMELFLEDADMSVVMHGSLPPVDRLFHLRLLLGQDAAAALGLRASLHGYEVREITYPGEEFPDDSHHLVKVPLFRNFLLLDKVGLVDVSATMDRLIAVREFLSLTSQDRGSFASVTNEMMLWLEGNMNPLVQTLQTTDSARSDPENTGRVNRESLVERLIEQALQEVTVISKEEIHAILEVLRIHVVGLKTRHFVQYGHDPHWDGALCETRELVL
jgi:hypothetical protein